MENTSTTTPALDHPTLPASEVRPICFTRITAPAGVDTTKRFDKGPDGQLKKTPAKALGRGNFETIFLPSMAAFPALLNAATLSQVHLYGVCNSLPAGRIVTEAFRRLDVVGDKSRTKQFFTYPAGPAIVACDIDAPQKGIAPTQAMVIDALLTVFPLLQATSVVGALSASSNIYDLETNKELRGETGRRLFFAVVEGTDIPRVFGVMIARLYLAGYGRFEISAAGSLLERSLIDKAMATATQPDFCGGARCGPGLEQRRPPAAMLWSGAPLDSQLAFQDLTSEEQQQYDNMRRAAKDALAGEAAIVRAQWKAGRVGEIITMLLKRDGKNAANTQAVAVARVEALRILEDAVTTDVLAGDFVIRFEDGTAHPVRHILRHRDRFHGRLCYDPIEFGYDGGRVVGKLFLKGKRPVLHTLAHGGKTFRLVKQRIKITAIPGQLAQCVEDSLDALREDSRIFSMGPALVRVDDDGALHFFTPATLLQHVATEFRYVKETINDKGDIKEEPINPPLMLGKTIIELGETRKLRKLMTVLTAPIMLPNGRILSESGYDEETALFLQTVDDSWEEIPKNPSIETLREAYAVFWKPLSHYYWKDTLSQGVALAMMLTAIVRPGLRIAPGFAVQASMQSSGKTFAIQAAGTLLLGAIPPVASADEEGSGSDSELRKVLLAATLEGKSVYLIDNMVGFFEDPALAASLTGGTIEGRILGATRMSGALPFRMFFCISGNNLQLGPDLCQRLLVADIDPRDAAPEMRQFEFQPAEYALEHRQAIVTAGLTLLQGFVAAGMPATAPGTSRFGDWDRLVRQAVVWLAATLQLEVADPMGSVARFKQEDSEQETLRNFLMTWRRIWGDQPLTSQTLHDYLEEAEAQRDYLRKERLLDHMARDMRAMLDIALSWSRNGKLPSVRTMGNILRNRRGKKIGGLYLERVGEQHAGVSCWRVFSYLPVSGDSGDSA